MNKDKKLVENTKKVIQEKKYNIEFLNKFNISWKMYTKWVYLLKEEEIEYLKNSPFKNKVKFL